MTFAFRIGAQRFTFGDTRWREVVWFDEQADLGRIKRCPGTKDVDLIALEKNGSLWLIEVTDYRDDPSEARKVLENASLSAEAAQKVRDTIPALVGASRWPEKPNKWDSYVEALTERNHKVSIVLWLEDLIDSRLYATARSKIGRDSLLKNLRKNLAWVTKHVIVENCGTYSQEYLDLKVEDIS